MTTELVVEGIQQGRIPLNAAACPVGSPSWAPMIEFPEFAGAVREVAPPPPGPTPALGEPREGHDDEVSMAVPLVRLSSHPRGSRSASEAPPAIAAEGASTLVSPLAAVEGVSPGDAPPPAAIEGVSTHSVAAPAAVEGVSTDDAPPAENDSLEEAVPLCRVTRAAARAPAAPAAPDDAARVHENDLANPAPFVAPAASNDGAARVYEDDLVSELFDAMHGLHFLPDAIEAGDYCLGVCMEKLSCEAGAVHVYQSDRREFVVTNARGAEASRLLLRRHAETDASLAAVMTGRRPVVFSGSAEDGGELERCPATDGVRRVMLAPIMPAGRFLGAIELFNPLHGRPFTQSDADAFAYVAQHFAEFIASHGVVTAQDRIRGRHEKQGAGRSPESSFARA